MSLNDRATDIEPEAGAAGARLELIYAEEAGEEMRDGVRGDARTIVGYGRFDFITVAFNGDLDGSLAALGMSNGILGKVPKYFANTYRIGADLGEAYG